MPRYLLRMANGSGTTGGLPFATGGGQTKAPAASGSGGNDFLTNPRGTPGAGGGGFDPVSQSRQQTTHVCPGLPDAASIPNGGKILKADPGKVGVSAGGNAERLGSEKRPFSVRKG